jgi:hypothetical protein
MSRRKRFILVRSWPALLALLLVSPGCSLHFDLLKKKPQPTTAPVNVPEAHTVADVPKDAKLIGQGTDPIRFTATGPGTVYVFSRDDRQVSLQYDLIAGETFSIQPVPGDGTKFVADRHTGGGAGTIPASAGGYEVYFQPRAATTTSPAEMAPSS